MDFKWDPAKERANVVKHGISFVEAAEIFAGFVLNKRDERFDYGEDRTISYGRVHGETIFAVVNARRDGHIRIISARRANRAERRRFETALLASPDS